MSSMEGDPAARSLQALADIPTDAIRNAAARVGSRWSSNDDEIVSSHDVTLELLELCRAIEAPDGSRLRYGSDNTTMVLRSGLLQELRQEILREWTANGPPDTAEMLRVLSGLDRAHGLIEPGGGDAVAKRLADVGGLDLVVEVAHDLRSPLTSILFLSDSMLRGQGGELNALQKRQLGIIDAAALRLVNMASDVIELARGGEQLRSAEAVPFSLQELLDPVRDLVSPMADQKDVQLQITLTAADHRAGAPVPLARVLLNLATNALRYARGHVEILVTELSADAVEFSVRDDGPGIEPEELKTLFHPFHRSVAARGGYFFSGTGLALNICRKLVRSMGGELQIETAPNWGTRFFFELQLPIAIGK